MPPPQVEIPASAAGQRTRFASAYAVLEGAIADHAFPGAAFGVLVRGEIVALDGVGRFTYDPYSPPVTASTVYDLASLTKVLAATSAAMLLHHCGQLQLPQPVADLIPGFPDGEPSPAARRAVTLAMLLAHSSGLPGYARLFETCPDRATLLEACAHLPLEAAPGARAEYSDPGFILLGRALEILACDSLDAFCAQEVFAPLGMTSTRYLPPPDWRSSIPPTEEDTEFRHRLIQGEVQDENCFVMGGVSGHAGLFSNALDPLLFARSLLGAGPRVFDPETVRLFTSRWGQPADSSRALGWDTPSAPSSSGRRFGPHSAGHLGYSGTSLWIDFDQAIAIVLLTNRTWPQRENPLIRKARPLFHDSVMEALLSASAT